MLMDCFKKSKQYNVRKFSNRLKRVTLFYFIHWDHTQKCMLRYSLKKKSLWVFPTTGMMLRGEDKHQSRWLNTYKNGPLTTTIFQNSKLNTHANNCFVLGFLKIKIEVVNKELMKYMKNTFAHCMTIHTYPNAYKAKYGNRICYLWP